MKKIVYVSVLFIVLWVMFLVGCNSDAAKEKETTIGEQGAGDKEAEDEDEIIYNQLFDINNKIEINIDITDTELAKLQEDYEKYSNMGSKSPIYRDTALSIKVTTKDDAYEYKFDKVGIRMKGNTSRTDFYSETNGIYNLIHFRIEFPEEFAGLEHLEIRWNKQDDTTYIREYYTNEFFRVNGILAQRTNLASVDVAGIHEGVFTICEPVDKKFIERNLPKEDQDGDLYKAGWDGIGAMLTADMTVGIEDEETAKFYNYDLKNNKKTSNHELMNNLLAKLNDGDVTKEELNELVDMEYFLKFAAVSYFIGNPDDIRYDYNNYYVYFLKSNNKAIFIPIDNDRTFGLTREWNPTGDGMTGVNPFSTMADGAECKQQNPLFIYTVDAGGYFIDEYAQALAEVAKSEWLTTEKFDSVYEIAYNNYKDDTTPSKQFWNTEWHQFKFDNTSSLGLESTMGNASFAEYIEQKMKVYKECVSDIEQYYTFEDSDVNNDIGDGYYIRATFNNWQMQDRYLMTYDAENDVYSYTLDVKSEEWLKISSSDDRDWYGFKEVTSMPSDASVTYDDSHYNIILAPGTYEILFYDDNKSIEINKK